MKRMNIIVYTEPRKVAMKFHCFAGAPKWSGGFQAERGGPGASPWASRGINSLKYSMEG